jgi:hypothetical protein
MADGITMAGVWGRGRKRSHLKTRSLKAIQELSPLTVLILENYLPHENPS